MWKNERGSGGDVHIGVVLTCDKAGNLAQLAVEDNSKDLKELKKCMEGDHYCVTLGYERTGKYLVKVNLEKGKVSHFPICFFH